MAPVKMIRGMAAYLVSEANGMYRSRDEGVAVGDANPTLAGTIVGRLTAGAATAVATAGNVGNPTMGAVTVNPSAVAGVYTVVFTSPTAFDLRAPSGDVLASGVAGTAVAGQPLGFTVTAGATAAEAGDSFNITVTATVGAFKRHTIGASDGTQTVAGILMESLEANEVADRTITTRDCEVNEAHLVYPAAATAAQRATINTALRALGIIVR